MAFLPIGSAGKPVRVGSPPVITFYFPMVFNIDSVSIWAHHTPGSGPVMLPASVRLGGSNFTITPDSDWGPRWLIFPG